MLKVPLNFEDKCKQCKFYIRAFFNRENQLRVVCNRTIIPLAKCISENHILFESNITYDNPQDPFYVLFEQSTEEELTEQLNDVGRRLVNYSNSVTLRDISKHQAPEYLKLKEESRLLSNRLIAVVKEIQRKQKLNTNTNESI